MNILKKNLILDQHANPGCSIEAAEGTFGPRFNSDGGGVFALEWERHSFIRAWVFKRGSVPADIAQVLIHFSLNFFLF